MSAPPRLLVRPPAASNAAAEAVELARSAGLVLDPWQELVLEAGLGERPDGKWSALEVGVIVPRQNGKGSILEARELAGLFLFGETLILHSAHEFKTAQEAFRRVLFLVENTPDLDRQVLRVRTSHGEEGIELRNGARLRFVARSGGSARGFSGDLVILDESYRLPAAAIAALFPTLSARPNPQVWYTTSSPPNVDEASEHIRRTRARAESDDPGRLAWAEWSCPPEVDPDDPAAWAAANPALGLRIEEEFVATERSTYPEETFLVERLGVWLTSSTASKIPAIKWAAREDRSAAAGGDVAFALDMPPDRSTVSVAVADREVVELVDQVSPETAVARAQELADRWAPLGFVIDAAGPAASLVPDLEAAGLRVHVTTARELTSACGRVYDAVLAGELRHRGQPLLNVAVDAAGTRKLGDAWAWSRSSSTVDISPLVAVTLALHGAHVLECPPDDPPRPVFVH